MTPGVGRWDPRSPVKKARVQNTWVQSENCTGTWRPDQPKRFYRFYFKILRNDLKLVSKLVRALQRPNFHFRGSIFALKDMQAESF